MIPLQFDTAIQFEYQKVFVRKNMSLQDSTKLQSTTEPPREAPKKKKNGKTGKNDTNIAQQEPFQPVDIRQSRSVLGEEWLPVFSAPVKFGSSDFEKAMANVIREPNINSTTLMRTDILEDRVLDVPHINEWLKKRNLPEFEDGKDYDPYYLLTTNSVQNIPFDTEAMPLTLHLDDVKARPASSSGLKLERLIVRRLVPRNPRRDPVLNQTCSVLTNRLIDIEEGAEPNDSVLIVYSPHIEKTEECPFYLPPVKAVGILYHDRTVSVHYILFDDDISMDKTNPEYKAFHERDITERVFRIAHHLGETAYKHSCGAKAGYKKRVHHDLIVPKVVFQDKYIDLKNRYSKVLVQNWVESTDPKKHVFEDLAIAAFVVKLWDQMYKSKTEFSFVDVGCGNGLLVNILINEGYQGYGIDARARKSWATYSPTVQAHLKEQVIVPKILLDQSPTKEFKPSLPTSNPVTYNSLFSDPFVNVADFPENAFLIGNHSDELTVWLPLFDRPFIVIPCCSHALSGAKHRFTPKKQEAKSSYASLVDHVEEIASRFGWAIEKESLRIPSTRNTALIGRKKSDRENESVEMILESEGGGDGWVERTMALRGKNPRNH